MDPIKVYKERNDLFIIPKIYIKITKSLESALVLNKIISLSTDPKIIDGLVHKSYIDWHKELLIPERTMRRILTSLEKDGLISKKTRRINGIMTLACRPNLNAISESINATNT